MGKRVRIIEDHVGIATHENILDIGYLFEYIHSRKDTAIERLDKNTFQVADESYIHFTFEIII